MPEYLEPGAFIEEVGFPAKPIEGVTTSITGFVGPTRYGPVSGPPELLTSFADFSRIYGGLDPLQFVGKPDPQVNFMAHAVRAFFDNGGSKLYVMRVYEPPLFGGPTGGQASFSRGQASYSLGSPVSLILRARFPGHAGQMRIVFAAKLTPNLLVADPNRPDTALRVKSVRENDVVYIKRIPGAAPHRGSPTEGLYDVTRVGGNLAYSHPARGTFALPHLNPSAYRVSRLHLTVRVLRAGQFEDEQVWPDLSPHPKHRNALTALFAKEPPSRLQYLTIPFAIEPVAEVTSGASLAQMLLGNRVLSKISLSLETSAELRKLSPPVRRPAPVQLERIYVLAAAQGGTAGSDGFLPPAAAYSGEDSGAYKTGLKAFEDLDEISIIAAPGYSFDYQADASRARQIVENLITHCQQKMKYPMAVLDSPNHASPSEVQNFRRLFDSTHAALYYPWITILDPLDPDGGREIQVPPSGFVAGIYSRIDWKFGVFKPPANEVVQGAIGLEPPLNNGQQDILNQEGINCIRPFEGRGFLVWGARTISSDPEWKYINVRRYLSYLEHSIDKGTRWAVFENNNAALWANVRRMIGDFLFNEWRSGVPQGVKPEEAFFVLCDRSTMTQNDLDNGRLVCIIGVALVKPAEFFTFRIIRLTANSKT